jgi:hypothetical protein
MSDTLKKLTYKLRQKIILKSLYKFDPWVLYFRLSSWQCHGNVFVLFLLVIECRSIIFAVATGATISCALGRQYGPLIDI